MKTLRRIIYYKLVLRSARWEENRYDLCACSSHCTVLSIFGTCCCRCCSSVHVEPFLLPNMRGTPRGGAGKRAERGRWRGRRLSANIGGKHRYFLSIFLFSRSLSLCLAGVYRHNASKHPYRMRWGHYQRKRATHRRVTPL